MKTGVEINLAGARGSAHALSHGSGSGPGRRHDFFFCLILAFYAKQHASHIQMEDQYILDWSPLTVPPILWINTAIRILAA